MNKPKGKRPLGRPRRSRKNIITMTLKQIGVITRNWYDSATIRHYWRIVVKAALDLDVPEVIELVRTKKWTREKFILKKAT